MLDILLDILGSLLGFDVKDARPAQPRGRAPAPPPDQPQPRAQKPVTTLEDLVKQMMGVEEKRRPREEREHRVRPPRKAEAPAPVFSVPAPGPVHHTPVALPEPVPEPVQPQQQLPNFVAALRANPGAARQAFVYSEIFGKPLADR